MQAFFHDFTIVFLQSILYQILLLISDLNLTHEPMLTAQFDGNMAIAVM
jgi:hypothetical protein